MGVQRTVFSKPAGLSYTGIGVKKRTFKMWKHFRDGVEGNISELKRAYGVGKVLWKYENGFAWSSILCYNLIRRARFSYAQHERIV